MEDGELITKLIERNEAAFEYLVREYQRQVFSTCYSYVQEEFAAEDLAQEVFIEVFRSISNFRQDAKLSTWIYRIATTKSLDHIKKQNRQKRSAKLKVRLGLMPTDIADPANSSTPETELENQERALVLKQALDTLPDKQRIAFTLQQYDGMSQKEISERMGLSEGAVESQLFRAKKSLRQKLERFYRNQKE
ncbi:MAG: RNA polymerase sigma factor [Salibacteraceae bacterium]